MNRNEHEGILAIFLAEAEEIVQRLSEQLAELHYGYDGQRILDDIHRGFHTLYGGAAVLELSELAECAQLSERLMERLRTRRLSLSPSAVSLILSAVEVIEVMLARRINHQPPEPLSANLKLRLMRAAEEGYKADNAAPATRPSVDSMGLFFDGRLQPRKPERVADRDLAGAKPEADGQITDDEFENLLDSLYGKGRGPTPRPDSRVHSADAGELALEAVVRPLQRSAVARSSNDEGNIDNLVQELSWVRNRLLRFQGLEQSAELDKALSYLDLVTQDMEAWLAGRK
ncbi:MAG: Hpt domain-containing protein [Zhongshania sp.]|uniref:Hpt domain-containing protein n=1 Tax=Zhongshania sp. TaxID=1971902 RepID=UPI00260215FC|nr:Hpt domain-containing protein [Zhongshania sp.]MDF1693405.1 Hpt domain-containing protein [Zhongshania sp.]